MDYLDKYDDLLKIMTELYELEGDGKMHSLKEDFEKFYVKGNKTSGRRIRKFMQVIRKASEQIRKDVQDYKTRNL